MRGDLLIVLSMIAAVFLTLLTKRLMEEYDPSYVTATMIVAGTVFLVAWTAMFEHPRFTFSTRAWLAVAAQGVLATAMAYMFWNWGMARLPAAKAGIFFNMEPLVGTLLGVLVLSERLGGLTILGGVMIIFGALYFSTRTLSQRLDVPAEGGYEFPNRRSTHLRNATTILPRSASKSNLGRR